MTHKDLYLSHSLKAALERDETVFNNLLTVSNAGLCLCQLFNYMSNTTLTGKVNFQFDGFVVNSKRQTGVYRDFIKTS